MRSEAAHENSMTDLFTPKGELKKMLDSVSGGKAVSAFGMRRYEKMIASAFLKRFVYVCSDISSARDAEEEFNALGLKTAFLPQKDDALNCAVGRSTENDFKRLGALTAFMTGDADVLVATSSALAELYPRRRDISDNRLLIQRGGEYDLDDTVSMLAAMGYERCEQVTGKGSFAVRGDILDVWSIGEDKSFRVEFFGDEAESVRAFDPSDQTANEKREHADIYPATDIFIDDATASALADKLTSEAKGLSDRLGSAAAHASVLLGAGGRTARLSFLLPLCPHESFAEFFAEDTVVFDDCKSVADNVAVLCAEHEARFRSLKAAGDTFDFASGLVYGGARKYIKSSKGMLAFHRVDGQNRLFQPDEVFKFESADIPDYSRDLSSLADDAEMWLRRGYAVTVMCGSPASREKLRDLFYELGKGGGADVRDGFLPHGGVFFCSSAVIIGTLDIGKRAAKKVIKRTGRDVFVLPEVGDYVVHRVHGIGLCENICKLNLGETERDYIVVGYAGGDKLYLPIENMDSLSKLVASEHPKLSKIGGADFARLTEKVRRSVKDMALGLAELYARRSRAKGYVYSSDDSLLDEFCADFPYSETEDQLIAVEEGLRDLKSGKIMDRLLCGDVGFGKTEVAMRLAFKVICEGKQVAFVSPTTILARQHYETVKARMEKFGVRVASLTRMNGKAQTDSTLSALAEGKVEILCGTHRVFGRDVVFADLGLLILDEEQRFGVADKEKIKKLKVDVGVLSLSATPIPRTLHMSMTGIRDISVLDTPPADRLPVQTFVTEYSEPLVADAIRREVGRGGQVFIVYNRVADIDRFAASVLAIVPECRVRVAHGQMNEGALGRVIEEFEGGGADVLVASTIIENGIDMPRANTMIVVDSDRLGLSQMYQLRGRVGRSNRLAYVYFTYDSAKILSEAAYKRLDAITQFTELSSGFKIAMRDLEIRGAGNILGREQHGHIEKVGYDMYCRILQSAVDELRGQKAEEEKNDVTVTCDFNAFVPESYVPDKEWRIRLYARIAKLADKNDCSALLADLNDIYGAPPKPAVNLVRLGLIKNLAASAGASAVYIRGGSAQAVFPSVKELGDYAASYIAAGKGVSFGAKEIRVKFTGRNAVEELTEFLCDCHKK